MRKRIVLALLLFLVSGCGKRGALIYPDMLVPAAPEALSVSQSGDEIRLVFTLPGKDRAGRSLKDLAGVRVYRRETAPGQAEPCNACSDDFVLFRQLYLDVPDSMAQRSGSSVIVSDANVREGFSYTYRITPFTRDAIEGAVSEPISVSLVAQLPAPRLQAVSAPTEVQLLFYSDKPHAGEFVGYNIYRAEKGLPYSWLPYNAKPLMSDKFIDERLKRHVVYRYSVRNVVRLSNGAVVESSRSNEVEAQLQDE